MPNAGDMRHRVQIQQRGEGVDEFGQPFDVWPAIATVWAAIQDRAGREFLESQIMLSETNTQVTIRYRSDLQPEWRLLDACSERAGCHGRLFSIINILDRTGRRRELRLECKEMRAEAAIDG